LSEFDRKVFLRSVFIHSASSWREQVRRAAMREREGRVEGRLLKRLLRGSSMRGGWG
jgi:hypothetical protein